MDDTTFIVEQLIAVCPDGRRYDVTIRVGKPYLDDGAHGCLVQFEPFDAKPRPIFGEGPMQALHLGLDFIKRRMIAEEEDRGIRFFHKGDNGVADGPAEWRQFWYGDPARPEAG